MKANEVAIVSAVRTPIGRIRGALSPIRPDEPVDRLVDWLVHRSVDGLVDRWIDRLVAEWKVAKS